MREPRTWSDFAYAEDQPEIEEVRTLEEQRLYGQPSDPTDGYEWGEPVKAVRIA